LLILAAPLSAFAEFTVTTNKDIYTPDEKAIIVGAIPEDAPDGYAVLVKVTGPGGDCASQNTLPTADNSFRARPVSLEGCGFGVFTVSAFYADQQTTSRIIISNSSQADAGSRLELRTLKTVMLQALDVVNAKVKELIEDGYILPEEVADKYSEGVSEASLALEALEFGDTAEAKRHMILAIQDFRAVLEGLDGENVTRFEQTASTSNSDIVGTYDKLERTYNKLRNVAEKNGVDKGGEFEDAARLLSDAREMMEEDNFEGAERRLEQVNAILEEIRADLYEEEEVQQITSDTNSTRQEDEDDARRLIDTALKYQKDALELLNQTGTNAEALVKVQEALSLIANATASVEAQELDLARDTLRAAHRAIIEAEKLIEDKDDASHSDSGEGSDDNNSGESPGEGSDDSGEGDNDKDESDGNKSGKGNDDEDDE
jgi:tetratricopeptide (TPR) repeat protein